MPSTEQILKNVEQIVSVFDHASLQGIEDLPVLEMAKWVIFTPSDASLTEDSRLYSLYHTEN
jgi:hypothetical protein